MRHFAPLAKDRSGVSTVEFAIILPALLTLMCGAIELGHMLLARVVLEGAMTEAARISTASLETAEAQRTTLMEESIEQAMGNFPLADGAHVSVQTIVYGNFSSAHPETYEDANANGHYDLGESYVVSYTVRFPKRILFGFLGAQWLLGDSIMLTGSTVVRNESVVRRTS